MKRIYLTILIMIVLCSSCTVNSIKEKSIELESSSALLSETYSSIILDKSEELDYELHISTDYNDYCNGDKSEEFDIESVDYNIDNTISNIKDNIKEKNISLTISEIYTYRDILYAWNQSMFNLGGDFSAWLLKGSIIYNGDSRVLLTYFTPENSRFYKEKYYSIYEIENYGRLYFYFSDTNGFESPVGYPLLISKKMKLCDFDDIKPGDSIYKIIAIDNVTEIYYAQYILSKVNSENVKYCKENGKTICSLHYLDEGILRIEYDVIESGEYIVDDIVLIEDYIFTDFKGNTYDLSIMEEDLP